MKYCEQCKKEYDTDQKECPVCGKELKEGLSEEEIAIIVASTTLLL